MAKLIFGCGYLGRRVARLWHATGETVYAVTRSAERATQMAAEGVVPIVGDITDEARLSIPDDIRTVLFAVGHERQSTASIHDVFVGGLRTAIASLNNTVERFIHISSTGVYGQFAGEEVDEDSPCEPTHEGGWAILAGERLLYGSRFAQEAIVLRLAGIYGPGRIALGRSGRRPADRRPGCWLAEFDSRR